MYDIAMSSLAAIQPLPPLLQWIGMVAGLAALMMAIPPMAQMLWGRPIVRPRFEKHVEGSQRVLLVFLDNPPVKNPLLKIAGVHRDPVQSLTAQVRISEAGNNRILIPIRTARIYSDDDPTDNGRDRITLPPTFSVAASLTIVYWDSENGKSFVPPNRVGQPVELSPGYYRADLLISLDGRPTVFARRFVVGQTGDDLYWA